MTYICTFKLKLMALRRNRPLFCCCCCCDLRSSTHIQLHKPMVIIFPQQQNENEKSTLKYVKFLKFSLRFHEKLYARHFYHFVWPGGKIKTPTINRNSSCYLYLRFYIYASSFKWLQNRIITNANKPFVD